MQVWLGQGGGAGHLRAAPALRLPDRAAQPGVVGARGVQGRKHADILLRVLCHAAKGKVVLLLAAYDKGKEPGRRRQQTEIALAQKRLKAYRALEAEQRKQTRRRGGGAKGKRRV